MTSSTTNRTRSRWRWAGWPATWPSCLVGRRIRCRRTYWKSRPGQQPYIAKSSQQLLEDFDKNVAEGRKLIAGATDADFAKIWTFKYGGQTIFSMPRAAVIRSMVMNHMIHHRAQLSVYLRLNEIEVPGMYGPSADEMKFWTAQNS